MKKGTIGKLVYLALALFIISLMLVPACAKQTPAPPGTSAPPTSAPPKTTAAPAATPQYGGTLTLLAARGMRNLGYPQTNSPPFNPSSIIPAFDDFLRKDNSGNPIPNLATGWKLDKDALTLTFTLQKGVKFHDGTPFNAAACKWNMEAMIASGQGELPNVKSIEALDDYTLRINMSKWDILMLNNFALKPGAIVSPTAVQKNGVDWAIVNPVYTGPFKFNGYQQDVYLKFIKNTDYWRPGKPYLDAVEWSYVADDMTRKAAFLAGQGQVNFGVSAQVADELKKTGKYNITSAPTGIYSLLMDGGNADSVWSKLEVRQAAAYAINSKELCDAISYGFYTPTNQIGYPGYTMYNPDIKGYPYNPQKAKDLLKAAGYPNGFKTTIYSLSDTTVNLAVQAYWKAVGIDANVEVVDNAKNSDLDINGWKNGVFTGHSPFVALGYPPAKTLSIHFSKKAIFFKSLVRPDEIDPLIDKSLSEPTAELHQKDTQEINRLLIDKYCVCIPLFVQPTLAAKVLTLHDDRICDPWQDSWFPEQAWLEKK